MKMTEAEIKQNLGRGKDIRGKKYGKLTPLYPLKERKQGRVIWHCKCDCGNEIDIVGKLLLNGHTKSCGCFRKESAALQFTDYSIQNKKFGKLTALQPTERRDDGAIIWKCCCDCGNICYVSSRNLNSGHTTSCGCLISKGEYKIIQILIANNIRFEQQKIFDTCKFPDTNAYAFFDFYLPDYNILIEYDGEQHFKYKNADNHWNNKTNFLKLQKHDQYKNQWCKENNISLIRIPYTKYNTLCIDDLLSQSNFIIN